MSRSLTDPVDRASIERLVQIAIKTVVREARQIAYDGDATGKVCAAIEELNLECDPHGGGAR